MTATHTPHVLCGCSVHTLHTQATLPNQMHAQLTELNGLKGNVGRRCIIMGLITSQVCVCVCSLFCVWLAWWWEGRVTSLPLQLGQLQPQTR